MKTDQTPKTCQVHYNQGKSGKLHNQESLRSHVKAGIVMDGILEDKKDIRKKTERIWMNYEL